VNAKEWSFWRKIIYLVAIAVLLGLLSWLGRPSTTGTQQVKESPGGKLAQLRAEHNLSHRHLGEIDPTGEAVKLATLGMRGIAANILWEKANRYKMKKDWTNLSATLEQVVRLQPNFVSVWRFQGWNLAYNVSAEFDDFRERYRWVIRGIDFLKEGTKYNTHNAHLPWYIGWVISQKIGRSDEKLQFRRLFKKDDDFHGDRPVAERDNWLVGKQWFRRAEKLVDEGAQIEGTSPVVFYSDAPMCQMNYADALEADGTFGEVARRAWMDAYDSWVGNRERNIQGFGQKDIPTAHGLNIQLNDQERFEQIAGDRAEKIDALEPGLREKILEEKHARLTDEQRLALETPIEERTEQEYQLAAEAKEATKVTNQDVARRIADAKKRKQALELAEQAADAQKKADIIRRYRQIVNFVYWGNRAKIEQRDDTLEARRLIYLGDRAFADADLPEAVKKYDDGLAIWRKVLDAFPELLDDETFLDDMVEVIGRYRLILDQLDEPFPKDFVLKDVLDKHQQQQ